MKKTFTILFILIISQFAKAQELKLFKDVYPGPNNGYPVGFFQTDEYLFFSTVNNFYSSDNPLWVSDGIDSSNGHTYQLQDLGTGFFPNIYGCNVVGKTAYFFYTTSESQNSLWKTDGTFAGTQKLKTFDPSNSTFSGSFSIVYQDKLYFIANSANDGLELWVSDGTEAGTKQLKDINKTGNSSPYSFFILNDFLYFSASDSGNNRQIWKTDGTEVGTVLVKDFKQIGGSLSSILGVFQNNLILVVNDSIHGYELWKSDGTDAGTKLLKDINPNGNSYPYSITHFKNKIYFTADDGVNGREIWTSDGTETGTQLFMDINKSLVKKYPYEFYVMNDFLYFNGYDETFGYELWKTDGTEAGTKKVKNIVSDRNQSPNNFISIGNTLFFVAQPENSGDELYMTDGTEAGTKIIEMNNIAQNKQIRHERLIVFKEKLYVVGNFLLEYGDELYVYDPKTNSGIQNIKNQSSYFYPNPAQNEIKIKNNIFTKVDIYDVNGRLVLESTNTKEAIDISSIPAGIYIIKMGNENAQITERLIKQ